jgi:hypothetical protein
MRTTIRLEDDLLKSAQKEAAATGRTFTQFVSEALREKLARRRPRTKRERVVLPTFKGDGTLPGVDLHNNASLLDLMDEYDAAARR